MQMQVELSALHRQLGSTMIYVTHDQVEAMTMADKIVVLNGGRVEQVGAPLDLYNRPANIFVAGFIGSPAMNFLSGNIEAHEPGATRVRVGSESVRIPRDLAAEAGAHVTLGIRPEHLSPASVRGIKLADVKVDLIENLRGESYFTPACPTGGPSPCRSTATTALPSAPLSQLRPTPVPTTFSTSAAAPFRLGLVVCLAAPRPGSTTSWSAVLLGPFQGNPSSRSSSCNSAGCRPSRIASTISGASIVSRRTRLTYVACTHFALAIPPASHARR